MANVFIAGIGMTPVGEHWETSLRQLAYEAVVATLKDANLTPGQFAALPSGIFVGNMLAGQLSGQEHLGALVADFCGLHGVEAVTVEAAGASGGMAVRQAYLAVASGLLDVALAVGVEKITDKVGAGVNAAVATATDGDWESAQGLTATAQAALVMRRYMHEHGATLPDFAGFSINAHANGKTNPNAMFRNLLTPDSFAKAAMIADPINMFDTAPEADGAAGVLLIGESALNTLGAIAARRLVRVAGSSAATEALAVHDRPDPLFLRAANMSAGKALQQAKASARDMNVFEIYDSTTVFAALSLEALGLAERGKGWQLARNGAISLTGERPIATFGGLKARGNPGGATGVCQVAEVALQLRGEAGANQVPNARRGLAQCLGSAGATAVTHVLEQA